MTKNLDLQSPPPSHEPQPPYTAPPVILTLTVVVLVFFFASIFSIYVCRCFMAYLINASNLGRPPTSNAVQPTGSAPNDGLDPSIIATFPTLVYSSVKDLRQGKCGLECAVCLAEFEDDDELRLLTVCNHVFHPECIDLWFGNHTTCPICRSSLLPPEKSPVHEFTVPPEVEQAQQENETREDNNSVSTKDEEGQQEVVLVVDEGDSHEKGATSATQDGEDKVVVKKRFRWHSTGHSIIHIEPDPNDERYTLKLPDHIKEHIVRGHKWTGSCIAFGEFSNNDSYRTGGLVELPGFSGVDATRV